MGKFETTLRKDGEFQFSEMYESEASRENGVASFKKNAPEE